MKPRARARWWMAVAAWLATWAAARAADPAAHWAYRPLERPPVPAVRDARWPRNDIDRFVLARLEREGLRPAPAAPPETLLRRASFAVTGLPPSPADVAAFARRHGDADYAGRVGAMLASRAHGEHWARHWMDVARYADSAGYELDYLFTHSWRYRDWLVRAFGSGMPFDRFLRAQLAGDGAVGPEPGPGDGVLFLTVGPMRFEGGIQRAKERENEWLTDLVDTTGSAFLGVTIGCARCHDHKTDPFTQADYYGLQAVFAEVGLKEERVGEGGGPGDTRPAFIRAVARDVPGTVRLLRRGEVELAQGEVGPSLPAALPGGGPLTPGRPRRAALADWMLSRGNPLVARAAANRAWQWTMGEGLARTPGDLGRAGEPPTHPELLDWLACELRDNGWDLVRLQRLMLDSATFRQSSLAPSAARAADPSRRWLAGFPRRRLASEELHDALLAASGELNPAAFGPPVVPPAEPWALAALRNQNWEVTKDPAAWNRRAVYGVVRRSIKLPFDEAFNAPDTVTGCARRDRTVVPSQALALLNGPGMLDRARALAGKTWEESGGDASAAAARAWPRVFGRVATRAERSGAAAYLRRREAAWARADVPAALVPAGAPPRAGASARAAAWTEWCLALLNANEFAYVD